MVPKRTCPRCGTEVRSHTLGGLCPECLMRDGAGPDLPHEESQSPAGLPGAPITGLGTSRFGDYELLEVIAHGGMGMVYKARQVSLNRLVALKMLLFGAHSSPAAVQRFRAEAVTAASLHHPNIVAIHEVGFCEGQHFLAMDYVEGQPLSALVQGKPLPARRAAAYLRSIAEAVHHAHEHGILHRDLKPANVLIDQEDQPRITDFGLAKRLESDSNLTLSGQVMGSPNYMSPEQAGGRRGALTRRSDVYSLGAMLYELLTGRPPFIGEGLAEIVPQVLNTEPLPPRALNPGVPLDLQTVCLKCLEKEPAKRYATALALAQELLRFLESKPVLARPVGRVGKTWRWCRRQPAMAALIVAVISALLLGSTGVLWQWRRAEQQRRTARQNELRALQSEYGADMHVAQQALLETGDLDLAIRTLDKHRPTSGLRAGSGLPPPDLRDWEWRFLVGECQTSQRAPLLNFKRWIDALALSSDGRLLAIRSGTNNVVVYDFLQAQTVAEIPAPGALRARTLAFIPGTHLLALATNEEQQPAVAIWDPILNRQKDCFAVDQPVRAVSFSPDARFLAILHERGWVTVLDMDSKEALRQFSITPPMSSNGGDITFSKDGARLIIGVDGRVISSDWQENRESLDMPSPGLAKPALMALASSPATANLIAWSRADPGSLIWIGDCFTGELLGVLEGHKKWVVSLAFSPDGQRLASASADHTIRVWNVADRTQIRVFQGHLDGVWGVAFLPDGHTLVSTGKDGSVRLWDLDAPVRSPGHQVLPGHVLQGSFSFAADGQTFVTVSSDGLARLRDVHTVSEAEQLHFLGTNLLDAAFSDKGPWLATLNNSGKVDVWDWRTRGLITNLSASPAQWGRVYFLSRFLLAYTGHHTVWETGTWLKAPGPPNFKQLGITFAPVSPTEDKWASADVNGKIKLWTLPGNQFLAELPGELHEVKALVFSPDGKLLAAAGADAWVNVYDVLNCRLAFRFRAYDSYLKELCFSPNGRRLAILTYGSADIWDFETQRQLLKLPLEIPTHNRALFSPDGDTLISLTDEGRVELWHAPSLAELDAEERAQAQR